MSTSRKTVIRVPLTLPVLIPLLIISACFQFLLSIVWRKTELQGRGWFTEYFTNSGCIHKAESTYPFSQIWIGAALLSFLSLKSQPDLLLRLESPHPTFRSAKPSEIVQMQWGVSFLGYCLFSTKSFSAMQHLGPGHWRLSYLLRRVAAHSCEN